MTPAQLTTLKADILANTATIPAGQPWSGPFAGVAVKDVPNTSDGNTAVAGWYNQTVAPAFWAWRYTQARMDSRRAILNTAGAGNQLDGLTGGKREALLWVLDDTIEPRLAAVRATIDDLTGSQNTLKAALLDSFKRQVRYIEKVFCTGTGSFAAPADAAIESAVSAGEIEAARNS